MSSILALRTGFAKALERWYTSNKRQFFWRKTRNPYEIWLAEVLLQRTRADLVERELPQIMERFPDVHSLARAPIHEIEDSIKRLGLIHRSMYIKKGAEYVTSAYRGVFPKTVDELLSIPSIGNYVANAITAFVYNQKTPIVDVNVVRLLTRVFNIKSNRKRPHTDPIFYNFLLGIDTDYDYKILLYAILDLASTVCTKIPKCKNCPLRGFCLAHQKDHMV